MKNTRSEQKRVFCYNFFLLNLLGFYLVVLGFSSAGFAARNSTPLDESTISLEKGSSFSKCSQRARTNLTAASRDRALFDCIRSHPELRGPSCFQVAKRFEYQTSSDQVMTFCLTERVRQIDASSCHRLANQFHFESNEDDARWACLLSKVSSLDRGNCQKIAQGMNSIPAKERALQFCNTRR